jgi:hypothetical protein
MLLLCLLVVYRWLLLLHLSSRSLRRCARVSTPGDFDPQERGHLVHVVVNVAPLGENLKHEGVCVLNLLHRAMQREPLERLVRAEGERWSQRGGGG